MFRKLKLATIIAVALSAVSTIDSAEAHIGGRGGLRIGGGLIQRARQPGNANGNRNGGNAGVAGRRPVPAPLTPKPAAPPVVQIGGTNSNKPPVNSASANTIKPTTGNVTSNTPKSASPVQAQIEPKVPANLPGNSNANRPEHLVFNLTRNAAPVVATDAPVQPRTGLSSETKQALEEALAADQPAAETALTEVVRKEVATKEVPLPQIPVGATVTLNGQDLSDKEGQVVLQIGEIALPATITEWKNNMVTCTLPVLGLTKSSKATLHVLKADGKTASMLNCELVVALPTR